MSLDATRWAWMQQVGRSSAKLVLLSLADRAGEQHTCYPSIERLHLDTGLDRKTIIGCLAYLEQIGLIERQPDEIGGAVYLMLREAR